MGELTRMIEFRTTEELAERLDAAARTMEIKRSEIIRLALSQYLTRYEEIRADFAPGETREA